MARIITTPGGIVLRKIINQLEITASAIKKAPGGGQASSVLLSLARSFTKYGQVDDQLNEDGSLTQEQEDALQDLTDEMVAALLSLPASTGIASVSQAGLLQGGVGLGGVAGSVIGGTAAVVLAVQLVAGIGLSKLILKAIQAARENGLTLIPENTNLSDAGLDGANAPYEVIGSLASDTITASEWDDKIATLAGSDTITMIGGSDIVLAGDDGFSTDTVDYTNIVDGQIVVSARGEFVRVEHGADVDGLDGVEVLIGSSGADRFEISDDLDLERIAAGFGEDVFIIMGGDLQLEGGGGNDRFRYVDGDVNIDGGDGTDRFEDNGSGNALNFDGELTSVEDINGSVFDDNLTITSSNLSIQTLDVDLSFGNDTLNLIGAGGTDRVTISGEGGDDTITVSGTWQTVNVDGGEGNDTITVTANTTTRGRLDGGAGNDTITGSNTGERIIGGDGSDTLMGGGGNDIYEVGDGDTINGSGDGSGDSIIFNGVTLRGPKEPKESDPNEDGGDGCNDQPQNQPSEGPPWEGPNGEMYEQSGSTLTITLNGSTLTINNFNQGNYGFTIPEEGESDNGNNIADCNEDPLVIDLDGDGLEFQSIYDGAYFDYGNDGFADRTAWVAPDDGLLVVDLNNDGRIIGNAEIFNNGEGGFEALRSYDSNADNLINADDTDFNSLLIWQDANGDGRTDEGELKTLSEQGIESISLDNVASEASDIFGVSFFSQSTVTRTDGSTVAIGEVGFSSNEHITQYLGNTVVDSTLAELPYLNGYGKVRDLDIAMTEDAALRAQIESLTQFDSANAGEFGEAVESIIFRWHRVEAVAENSRGSYMDGQELAALEQVFGENYDNEAVFNSSGQPRPAAASILQSSWINYFSNTAARLFAQTDLGAELFPELGYYSASNLEVESGTSVTTVLSRMSAVAPTDSFEALSFWRGMALVLEAVRDQFVEQGAAFTTAADAALIAAGIDFSFDAMASGHFADSDGDILIGRATGNANGFSNSDLFVSGVGDDDIRDLGGVTEIVFGEGRGNDTVLLNKFGKIETTIRFQDLTFEDLEFSFEQAQTDDIIIKIISTGETITIRNLSLSNLDVGGITLAFSDGTTFDLVSDVTIDPALGTEGNDDIMGSVLGDTLDGGEGDDIIDGGSGGDTYIFGQGSGSDTFSDSGEDDGVDIVQIDSDFGDVLTDYNDGDFLITLADGNVLTVVGGGDGDFESFVFNDRTFTGEEFADLLFQNSLIITGTDGDDVIVSDDVNSSFPREDNTLLGGLGDDGIQGGRGGDTYIYRRGDGADVIEDNGDIPSNAILFGYTPDTLQIEGYTPDEVSLSRISDSNDDLVLTFIDSGDSVTIRNQLETAGIGDRDEIELITFEDGTVWTIEDVRNILLSDNISNGDDAVLGFDNVDDIIEAGEGNDTLTGLSGDDTYIFTRGDGNDSIVEGNDRQGADGDDVLILRDLSVDNLIVVRNGADIILSFSDAPGDSITVPLQYSVTNFGFVVNARLERVLFEDTGTTLTSRDILDLANAQLATDGDDTLTGTSYAETFVIGNGNDTVSGAGGNDIYIRDANATGSDVIDDGSSSTTETLILTNILPAEITATLVGDDVVLQLTNGTLTLRNQLASSSADSIEIVEFDDGTRWNYADITALVIPISGTENVVTGTASDETNNGTTDDDLLGGDAGDDFLLGVGGSDLYVWGAGAGNDTIFDNGVTSRLDVDRLELIGLNPEDVTVTRVSSRNLTITNNTTDEVLTIAGQFEGSNEQIEFVLFADGTIWNAQTLANNAFVRGTDGDDDISVFDTSSGSNETVIAGLGNDIIRSGDNFEFTVGDGQDLITSTAGGSNTIYLHGVTRDQISFAYGPDFASGNGLREQDLVISYGNLGDTITIEGELSENSVTFNRVAQIILDDGTIITNEEFESEIRIPFTDGDDNIVGRNFQAFSTDSYDDILQGGLGDDQLDGRAGNDLYIYASGDGNDIIDDSNRFSNPRPETDTLRLVDLNQSDISLSQLSTTGAVIIRVLSTSETITLEDRSVEVIEFADGTFIRISDLSDDIPFVGTNANESLNGSSFDNTLQGLQGDDVLRGNGGSDTYLYSQGDGDDLIREFAQSGSDVLEFTDVDSTGVTYTRNNESNRALDITVIATGEVITIQSQFNGRGSGVEEILFSNGERVAIADLSNQLTFEGTNNDDEIIGDVFDNTLIGAEGSDTLEGLSGSDTYVWALGDGDDTITDLGDFTDIDSLSLTDVVRSDVNLARGGNDLIVQITDPLNPSAPIQTVRINDQFRVSTFVANGVVQFDGIEQIVFADGETISREDLSELFNGGQNVVNGTAGDDILQSTTGNDLLVGGQGEDAYLFARGDGEDIIVDTGGDTDFIEMGAGISPELLVPQRDGNDLLLEFGGEDRLTLRITDHYNSNNENRVEEFRFEDGTVITALDINQFILQQSETEGDDIINGFSGNDRIRAGGGDDVINGQGGLDLVDGGDGYDTLVIDGFETAFTISTVGDVTTIRSLVDDGTALEITNVERIEFTNNQADPDDSSFVSFIENTAPTTTDLSFDIQEDQVYTILVSDILAAVTDAEGNSINLLSLSDATNGSVNVFDTIGGFLSEASDATRATFAEGISQGSGELTITTGSQPINVSDEFNLDSLDYLGIENIPNLTINGTSNGMFDAYVVEVVESGARISVIIDTEVDYYIRVFNANGDEVSDSLGPVDAEEMPYWFGSDFTFISSDNGPYLISIEEYISGGELISFDPIRGEPSFSPIVSGPISAGENYELDIIVDNTDYDLYEQPLNFENFGSGNAEIVFMPDVDFNGEATFEYTVIDSLGETATGNVTLNVNPVNDAPVSVNDLDVNLNEDNQLVIDPLVIIANDTDVDGDTLSLLSVQDPEFGAVELINGIIVFTPDENYNGPASFSYTVSDGNGGEATQQVSIDVLSVNDAPEYIDIGGLEVSQNDDAFFLVESFVDQFSDIEGDNLSFVSVQGGVNGVVSEDVDGVLIFTPDASFVGTASFDITVTDGVDETTATINLNVVEVNQAPTVGDVELGAANEDIAITFTAADLLVNSSDLDGDALSLVSVSVSPALGAILNNGDGTYSFTPIADFNGNDVEISFTVSDGELTASAVATLDVVAVNDAPVANDDSGLMTNEDVNLVITAAQLLGNDSDVDADMLSIISVQDAVGGTVSLVDGDISFTPADNYNGPASFTYMISDGNGGTSTASASIDVTAVNDNPEIGNFVAEDILEDEVLMILESDLIAVSSDIDGDDLSVTDISVDSSLGSLIDNGDGSWSFMPMANFNGTDVEINFTVSDGELTASSSFTFDVIAVNDGPVALDDEGFVTDEDTVLTITAAELLANDSDIEGDLLNIISVQDAVGGAVSLIDGDISFTPAENYNGPASFTYTISDGNGGTSIASASIDVIAINDGPEAGNFIAGDILEDEVLTILESDLISVSSDIDGDDLSITDISVDPSLGNLIDNGDGSWSFTPTANFNGPGLTLSYIVSDGSQSANGTVMVNVTPVNDAPIAGNVDLGATDEDIALSFTAEDLLANSVDVEMDDLSVIDVSVDAAFGSITDNGDGTYIFTPAPDFNGEDIEIAFTVSDGELTSSAVATLDIIAVNDGPVLIDDGTFTTDEDMALVLTTAELLANDSDIDGGALVIMSVQDATGGSVSLQNGNVTFTPTENYNGPASFTYTVSDGNGGEAPANVSIDVTSVNDAPIAGAVDLGSTDEDVSIAFIDADLLAASSDVDSGALFILGVFVDPSQGSTTANGDGTYSFTPAENFNGEDIEIGFTVTDGELVSTAVAMLDVIAVNDGPMAVNDGGFETVEGESLTLAIADLISNDSDVDGDALSVTSVQSAVSGTVSIVGSNVVFTPAAGAVGAASFTYTVSDGNGGEATASVDLTITADTGSSVPTPGDDVLTGTPGDDVIDALQGDDLIDGLGGQDILIGGRGSDTINGGSGNDILTGDEVNGANDRFDQDIFVFGDVQNTSIGNDIITDFDTNNYRGGENNYDMLSFTFDGVDYNLSTGRDIVEFVDIIEHDGDYDTDAIRDGSDIIFVFQSDEAGIITDSVRLEDVRGDDGIWNYRLNNASIDNLSYSDIFAVQGGDEAEQFTGTNQRDALYGLGGNDTLIGGRGSDYLRGGEGDDTLTGDKANGVNNRYDRDTFLYGDVDMLSIGNDIITDFDTNNYRGGENNYDILSFTFDGHEYDLSTGRDIVNFVYTIEHDGDKATDALRDGNDIVFVFGRDTNGNATDSIRLEDVIGDDGITTSRLNAASIDDFATQNTAKISSGNSGQYFFNTIKYGAAATGGLELANGFAIESFAEGRFNLFDARDFRNDFDFVSFDDYFLGTFNSFEMTAEQIERFDRDDLITNITSLGQSEFSVDMFAFEGAFSTFDFDVLGFRFDIFDLNQGFESEHVRNERLDIDLDVDVLTEASELAMGTESVEVLADIFSEDSFVFHMQQPLYNVVDNTTAFWEGALLDPLVELLQPPIFDTEMINSVGLYSVVTLLAEEEVNDMVGFDPAIFA